MLKRTDMSIWQGRIDEVGSEKSLRWHQKIQAWDGLSDLNRATVLLGFACDEGVRRNQGRTGARDGPRSIRSALCNLSYHGNKEFFDAGDVVCEQKLLETAQGQCAEQITQILKHNGNLCSIGGGHEIAWASYLGLSEYYQLKKNKKRLGIINFDAHFDLRNPQHDPRNPQQQATSGTPFHQIAKQCELTKQAFNYLVFGINASANTSVLFDYAKEKNVSYYRDTECTLDKFNSLERSLQLFLNDIEVLYVTICLDVFPGNIAPGTSAPAAIGIDPTFVIQMLHSIKKTCIENHIDWRVSDIAEMNPIYDINQQTAKLAARMVYEISDLYPLCRANLF